MSRSLPLGPATAALDASVEPVAASPVSVAAPDVVTLAGAVQLFDPAMCCPTGLCGPGVDPALIRVARDVRWLVSKGVTVERFGLSQEPQAFVANPTVSGLMQSAGDAALPVVLVNGAIVAHGHYPTRDEFIAALSASPGGAG